MENQLLGVKNEDDEFTVIIWPYGYSLSTEGNRIQVLDEKDQPQVRLGDYFTIRGGDIESSEFNKVIQTYGVTLPSNYRGSIWVAAPTSEMAYLPRQLVKFRDQPYPTDTISGNLKIEEDNSVGQYPGFSVRLISEDGKSYLPIWPNVYYLGGGGGEEVMLKNYEHWEFFLILKGSNIILGGGEISAETVEKYIGVSLPQCWYGPYWLVSDVVVSNFTP